MKDKFNVFELAAESPVDFIGRSCEIGIECDVLVISGHFAGSFFGSTPYRVSTEELELKSCEKRCDGLLKKPKEVFLFGCSTLATKAPDHRTAAEYADLLVEHYQFSRIQAEHVAAFRYSPIGSEYAERMRRVFPNARLYGFSGVGPSGKNVRPMLNGYLNKIPDYTRFFRAFDPLHGADNKLLRQALRGTAYAEARGVGPRTTVPACILNDKKATINARLNWINGVFRNENERLRHLPLINRWLGDLLKRFNGQLPEAEAAYLERIQFSAAAKQNVLAMTEKTLPGLVSAQVEILDLSARIGWITSQERMSRARNLLGTNFKQNLRQDQTQAVCSMNISFDLTLAELPAEAWTLPTLTALHCLNVRDRDVLLRITTYLDNPDLALTAAATIARSGVSDPALIAAMGRLLNIGTNRLQTYHAFQYLYGVRADTLEIWLKMAVLVRADDPGLSRLAIQYLHFTKADHPEIRRQLIFALHADIDPQTAVMTAKMLILLGERSPHLQLAMAEATYAHPAFRQDERLSMIQMLGEMDAQDPTVHIILANHVQRGSPHEAIMAVITLGKLKTPNAQIQKYLAQGVSLPERTVRAYFIQAFDDIRPTDRDVLLTLVQGLKDPDESVRADIRALLTRLAPQDPEVLELMRADESGPR